MDISDADFSITKTEVEEITSTIPEVFSLSQNVPNPFSQFTSLQLTVHR